MPIRGRAMLFGGQGAALIQAAADGLGARRCSSPGTPVALLRCLAPDRGSAVPWTLMFSCSLSLTSRSSFFFFLAAPRHMKFQGQGSDLDRSRDLYHSGCNAGSLTHCARLGTKPASQSSRDTADPTVSQRELRIPCSLISCPLFLGLAQSFS